MASLYSRKVPRVGIDSPNIDDTADMSRPVYSAQLGGQVPVVDHLPADEFRFLAVPVTVKTLGTLPVRAFELVQEVV